MRLHNNLISFSRLLLFSLFPYLWLFLFHSISLLCNIIHYIWSEETKTQQYLSLEDNREKTIHTYKHTDRKQYTQVIQTVNGHQCWRVTNHKWFSSSWGNNQKLFPELCGYPIYSSKLVPLDSSCKWTSSKWSDSLIHVLFMSFFIAKYLDKHCFSALCFWLHCI